MNADVKDLLNALPPYNDEWEMIHPDQSVPDIINEVVEAHELFSPYYDNIALYFDDYNTEEICNHLYRFLKTNVKYKEETDKDQTSALPTGILIRGKGDCKHYSGFIAGVLDALKRQGRKIDWCYRFASYRPLDKTPHHVFVVVNPGKNELWVDPTPGADKLIPLWQVDQKIKSMALRRNISGFDNTDYIEYEQVNTIGKRPFWQLMPMMGARSKPNPQTPGPDNKYFTGPFLGLQFYAEDGMSTEGTNWNTTADAINQEIAKGPQPGHTVDGNYVHWIFDTNFKGYNFLYPGGVPIGYVPNLPNDYPHLVITDDGLRLTFDRDVKIDDYKNDEIHALNAWVNSLIYENDDTPLIQKPRDLKEFSQLKRGDVNTRNFFNMSRRKTMIRDIGKAIGSTLQVIKKGVFKIVGSIPRNAFLGLVGINAFNFAGNMWEKIQAGKWSEMAAKWQKVGGNPEKLKNTIEDAKDKPAILGSAAIGEPMTAAALLAAAAPIIAAMVTFLDKNGKARPVLAAVKASLQAIDPDIDLSAYGFLDQTTGKEIDFTIDDIDNENLGGGNGDMPKSSLASIGLSKEMMIGIGTAGAVYLVQGKKKNILLSLLAGAGAYFFSSQSNSITSRLPALLTTSIAQKKSQLLQWSEAQRTDSAETKARFKQIIGEMTDPEINAVYDFIFNYVVTGKTVPQGSTIYYAIQAISTKYNIFT